MSYQQKDGEGVLYVNAEKRSERSPDYSGSVTIGGQQFWLSAWNKETRDGRRYISVAAKPKLAQEHQGAPRNPPDPRPSTPVPQTRDAFDDDIPF